MKLIKVLRYIGIGVLCILACPFVIVLYPCYFCFKNGFNVKEIVDDFIRDEDKCLIIFVGLFPFIMGMMDISI